MISNQRRAGVEELRGRESGRGCHHRQAGREEDLANLQQLLRVQPAAGPQRARQLSSPWASTGTYAIKPDLGQRACLDISLYADPGTQYLPTALGIYLAAEKKRL